MKERTDSRLKRVLVPGTFDPITNGHLDVITRATTFCDEVIVGVAASRSKRGGPTFSLEERVELVREATKGIESVTVMPFEGLLVDFAREMGAGAVVKGLRAMTDFEYEFQQAAMNWHLDQHMETLFIMSSPTYSYLSSSIVRELAQFGGNYESLVPPNVYKALRERFDAKTD